MRVTPESLYRSRREFLQQLGLGAGGLAVGFALNRSSPHLVGSSALHDELGGQATPAELVSTYNNYHEFQAGGDHATVHTRTSTLALRPWTVEVQGLVRRPLVLDVDDLARRYPAQERIYRMRCVEGWSMVIPWLGFPLNRLLKDAEPLGSARFVKLTSLHRPEQLPSQHDTSYPWPYVEGLRLDEALHDLTIVATGLYGRPLPVVNGAPVRIVVPWKYGFKSAKGVVRIELVEEMPVTFWMKRGRGAYGFYANVNPAVPHPRWTQASERRIGDQSRRRTLPFNGYGEQVASLYAGMDLRSNF